MQLQGAELIAQTALEPATMFAQRRKHLVVMGLDRREESGAMRTNDAQYNAMVFKVASQLSGSSPVFRALNRSIALSGPIARALRTPRVAPPSATARGSGEIAGPRGVFVMNCDRGVNHARARHASSEF